MSHTKVIAYLVDELERRRLEIPSYSLRNFSSDLGLEVTTVSRLMNGKRALSFKIAREILDALEVPPGIRNDLLLSLDGSSRTKERSEEILSDEELEELGDWITHAAHRALDIQSLEHTHSAIAERIGAAPDIVERSLGCLQRLGKVAKEGDAFVGLGKNLFTKQTPSNSEILRQKNRNRIEKSLDVLDSDLSQSEFQSMVFTIPRAKFEEVRGRIAEFARTLSDYTDSGMPEEIVMLNMQMFTIKDRQGSSGNGKEKEKAVFDGPL